MTEKIFLKLRDGYVNMAHVIESQSSITISLNKENIDKLETYTEISIYKKKISINHEKTNIVNDLPENDGYPYEIRYDGKNVGYKNFPSNVVLTIFETMILGFPESHLLPSMNEKGKVIDLKQDSDKKLYIKILFTKDAARISDSSPRSIIDTNKGKVIFIATR